MDEVCRELEKAFIAKEIDAAYIIFTRFKSAMSQEVTSRKLLPMDSDLDMAGQSDEAPAESSGRILFEPSPEQVFEAIVPRILRTTVRQAALDNKASEHGSRMVAMDSATKNAGELATSLKLTHNRLRQSAITGELLDIIGGAESVKG